MQFLDGKIVPITPELLTNLEDRGFDVEQFLKLGLGVGVSTTYPGAFAVPFWEGAKMVGMRICDAESFATIDQLLAHGAFYNADRTGAPCPADKPLIVTDRIDRCWAALSSGIAYAVAVPTIAVDGSRRALVDQNEALWRNVKDVVLCMADDAAGHALRDDLADAFGRQRCRWASYPKGCPNLSEAFRQYGAKGVQETVQRSRWMTVPNIYSMSELPEPAPNPALDCGMVGLREHYKLRRGDLTVVSGVPSSGKTSFVNEIVCRMVAKHEWRVVFASFEQRPKPDHRRALRTFHAGKLEVAMSAAEKEAADAWIDKHFRFLVPDDDSETNVDWLLATLETAVRRFDAHLCVIDPWNELEHVRPHDMSGTEYTGVAIRAIKRFAKLQRVHVIVVAHPAKMQRNAKGEYPKPSLYDIADSAHWYNKPDVGILIWRDGPEAGKPTQIVVAKSRYHSEIGRPGQITGVWNEMTGRYTINDDGGMP